MIMVLIRHPATRIWLLLSGATALSWWFGSTLATSTPTPGLSAGVLILLIAFIKCHLILAHFMEVRHAPLPLRVVSVAWVLVVGAALLALYV